jgi:alpha-glucosidase (family GH31 glycosyl hydrolase)
MPTSTAIRPLAPNIVRVTHYDPTQGLPDDRSWIKDVLFDLPESEKTGPLISPDIQNELVIMHDLHGNLFFEEDKLPVLGIQKSRRYFYLDKPMLAICSGQHKVEDGIQLEIKKSQDESFYGWGEWFNAFERKSGQVQLDNRNALFDEQDRLTYSGIPFFISSRGYGFLLLNAFRSQWTIEADKLVIKADGPGADYILIYGPGYKEIIRSLTALTGRAPLLPRWGFGLWVTGYPQLHQDTVLEHVRMHREKEIPLDAVILDYHWEERFHNFKWRQKLFPDPTSLVNGLNKEGIRLGLILTSFLNTQNRPFQKWVLNKFGQNVTPGLEKDDERALEEFSEAKEKGFLAHENVRWWFGAGGMLDFTHPRGAAWWQEKLGTLFESGASFIKNDDGEDLPDDARSFTGMDGREYHNIYGLYYGRATYTAKIAEDANPAGQRKIIYARTGWLGSQRYPALFLGDQEANFDGIKRGIRAGLNLGLAGFAYWTADVFGLSGKTTPEVHMRYAQWSLLNPVARYFIRPPEIDDTRFPWSHHQQAEDNFRKYAQLRMRLLPYYNNLGHESHQTGLPILRPLLLEYQQDERLRSIDDQLMIGDSLMICPIVTQGSTARKIILPEGVWHDFWSEKSWQGPDVIDYPAPIDCLPMLVRGGSMIPMGPVIQHIPATHIFDELDLHCWPPYPCEGILIDDDGISEAYLQGEISKTTIRVDETKAGLIIWVGAAQGAFAGQAQSQHINLVIHTQEMVENILVNDVESPFETTMSWFKVQLDHAINQEDKIEIEFRS